MGYLVTISNGSVERFIRVPGLFTDEEWRKRTERNSGRVD